MAIDRFRSITLVNVDGPGRMAHGLDIGLKEGGCETAGENMEMLPVTWGVVPVLSDTDDRMDVGVARNLGVERASACDGTGGADDA